MSRTSCSGFSSTRHPRTILLTGCNPCPNVRDYNPTAVPARKPNGRTGSRARVYGAHIPEASLDKARQPWMAYATIRRGILVALREIEVATMRPPRRRSGARA